MSERVIAKVESFMIKYGDYVFYVLGIFTLLIFAFIIWRRRRGKKDFRACSARKP